MTNYLKIYALTLRKLKDYNLPQMTQGDVESYLFDLLMIAIPRFHICDKLSERNDDEGYFEADLTDKEMDILSNYMLLQYIDSEYLITSTLLSVGFSSSDVNAFSNANHLDKMTSLHDTLRRDTETLVSRYSYENKYKAVDLLGREIKK